MASATATFSFHQLPIFNPSKSSKTHLSIPLPIPKKLITLSPLTKPPIPSPLQSINLSNEDKPLSEPDSPTPVIDSPPPPSTPNEEADEMGTLDRRRLEERFAVLNTGVHECRSCGYLYKESAGDPSYPIPPGLGFADLPDDWRCATCGAAKSFFVSKSVEIAGFAENQQFGLGGNTLTSGQKGVLIYGGLLLGFALFLSGYFLQ